MSRFHTTGIKVIARVSREYIAVFFFEHASFMMSQTIYETQDLQLEDYLFFF
jgi:hypothetical protein